MSTRPQDDLDRILDETLASMVEGEPRRVSAASVRQAMGESRPSRLPIWLAAAAALLVALGVAVKREASVAPSPTPVASHASPPAPVESRPAPSESPIPALTLEASASSRRVGVPTTTEATYEGLPRLTIASIDPPVPLTTERIDAGVIQIPQIEIAPLSISSLTNEPEHQ